MNIWACVCVCVDYFLPAFWLYYVSPFFSGLFPEPHISLSLAAFH